MANQWFRLYAEFSTDPKVQMLSEQDQRRLVMLFCMRCNVSETLQDNHVTFHLRITAEEWSKTKSVFIASGFIDSDNNVLNWDKRQYISDSSTARVLKHRDKMKRFNETTGNVTVTPPEQNRTEQKQSKPLSEYSDEFIQFWDMWPKSPRKGSKSKCFKVWKSNNLDSQAGIIFKHIVYCKSNGVWKDPQFISAPLVYLNQSKWDGAEIASDNPAQFCMDDFLRKVNG